MKGDFTRFTFDPRKHYSRVLQQQGRVQLDADWNEQADTLAYRDRTLAVDVIGPCGAPKLGGGLAVSAVDDGDFMLSPGRLYVGGRLCELREETTYLQQPYLPRPTRLSPVEGGTYLVYLDVWERHITVVEDPDIRDPALGGPDTATRVQTVWQVRVMPGVGITGCDDPVDGWPPPTSNGRVAANARGDLESRLYRIEIHDGGETDVATFKWSRDNGSVVFAVRELVAGGSPETVAVVEGIGRAHGLLPEEGDWVEVSGDTSELMTAPGTMARIERVDADRSVVWLDRDASFHAKEPHLKFRRWDQRGEAQAVTRSVVELEDGVFVEFSGESFRTGDYWMFPVRAAQGPVEWPSAPPSGIQHDYCRLALVRWEKDAKGDWSAAITDCRPRFSSLSREPVESCEECREKVAQLRAMLEEQALALQALRAQLD